MISPSKGKKSFFRKKRKKNLNFQSTTLATLRYVPLMASSAIFFSFFLGLSLHVSADKPSDICPVRVCHPHGPEIRFPFRVRDFHPERCGYPGFDLSCNIRGQAILQLPNLQYFVVDLINYEQQYVVLKEPSSCLAKRLQNLTLSSSPFLAEEYGSYTFASCIEDLSLEPGIERVDCLSDQRNNVLYSSTGNFYASWYFSVFKCQNWTVSVPVSSQYPTNITERVVLRWDLWDCGGCEKSGGRCGLKIAAGSDVGCFGRHGACLDSLLPPEIYVINPLERDSKRPQWRRWQLPRPNDNTCAICLSEYQPKETLRTIPACGHYFHAQCIDRWLRRNASCPLCRGHKGEVLSSEPGIEQVNCLSDQRNNMLFSSTGNFYAFRGINPDHRVSEKSGGRCGLKGSAGSDVGCFGSHGWPFYTFCFHLTVQSNSNLYLDDGTTKKFTSAKISLPHF
ncbi:putative RING-H2 finger protein ATL21A [Rhodamnia argentea]|uniref:RING-type E3 ubiquitin transferase n=1 Tax=Rhodamnia argentea TaxID=178133 RepID=A0ABM3H4V1_9MYRT|nr:putative RING-H2 finger protein ATL21A [Rhodamnia argentea]